MCPSRSRPPSGGSTRWPMSSASRSPSSWASPSTPFAPPSPSLRARPPYWLSWLGEGASAGAAKLCSLASSQISRAERVEGLLEERSDQMEIKPALALPEGLGLAGAVIEEGVLTITVVSTRVSPSCPLCGTVARRIHSHYHRCVADLPCGGVI